VTTRAPVVDPREREYPREARAPATAALDAHAEDAIAKVGIPARGDTPRTRASMCDARGEDKSTVGGVSTRRKRPARRSNLLSGVGV
jgi:hypothetical protein